MLTDNQRKVLEDFVESFRDEGVHETLESLELEFQSLKRPYFPDFVNQLSFRLQEVIRNQVEALPDPRLF